ncbi:hypothetical protein [Lederbergia lenta]|uniref:hypothetical protein n=1 Tax=Lederbergia lenta TaxID=1467 RepID=UPI00203BEC10|nr:hypothetical protein [Lederbergia lenta]MCM3111696.1 hypothetical protein [Lederbergia lenta]
MNSLVVIMGSVKVPWYDLKIFHILIGALISLTTLLVTQYLNEKRERRKNKETILNWLTLSNSSLFVLIYKYSIKKDNIDYTKLRTELERIGGFIYILPADLKVDFETLYSIHQLQPKDYMIRQNEIAPLLESIVYKLNKYGEEAFEHK